MIYNLILSAVLSFSPRVLLSNEESNGRLIYINIFDFDGFGQGYIIEIFRLD